VQACIAFYGIYDLAALSEAPPPPGLIGLWQRYILKKQYRDHRDAFVDASPLHHVRRDAPPFLIVHGTHDSMAPTDAARSFARALRETSAAPVVYAELPGAQHSFDIFHSVRTHHMIRGVHRFLAYVLQREDRAAMRSVA
jgi:dipeptidyl aminopeptidase/acylaminoacyl peptidase